MSKSQSRTSESREIPIKVVSEFSLSDDQLRQRIATKAYELYECRGCCHGHDVEDWLEAERLVLAELEEKRRSKTSVARKRSSRSTQRKAVER